MSLDKLTVLREARRVADLKGWVREALMAKEDGTKVVMRHERASRDATGSVRLVTFPGTGVGMTPADEDFVECDEVAACCTIGMVDFAVYCLLGAVRVQYERSYPEDAALRAVEAVLWARDEVRETIYKKLEGMNYPGQEFWEEYVDSDFSLVGDEGLLAYWNDNIATSADDVRALLDEAIEAVTKHEEAIEAVTKHQADLGST